MSISRIAILFLGSVLSSFSITSAVMVSGISMPSAPSCDCAPQPACAIPIGGVISTLAVPAASMLFSGYVKYRQCGQIKLYEP